MRRFERDERDRFDRLRVPKWAAIGGAVALVATLVFGALAWSAMRTTNASRTFEPTGRFAYTLDADYRVSTTPSLVYPTGAVGTGFDAKGLRVPSGPLYTRLLDTLHLDVVARARRSGQARRITATLDGRATISTPEGWSTVVATAPEQALARDATVPFDISVPSLQSAVAAIGRETGVGGAAFRLTFDVSLTVDRHPTHSSSVSTPLDVARISVRFDADGDVAHATPITSVVGEVPVGHDVVRAETVSMFGIPVRVDVARIVFPGLFLVALGAAVACALVVFGGVGLESSQRIAARYRTRIVDVASTSLPGAVVHVHSIAELARIARAEQAVILHETLGDGTHRYRVVLGAVTYEFQTMPDHAGHASAFTSGEDENP
jgi:hypothetical protein